MQSYRHQNGFGRRWRAAVSAVFWDGVARELKSRASSFFSLCEWRNQLTADIRGHPQFPLPTGQATLCPVRLTIMTLAWSTFDWPKASRTDVEHLSMARRNRAEVAVADEVGVYHCVQRVVRRAFLCGGDPLSGNSTIIASPGFGTAWIPSPGSSAWRSRLSLCCRTTSM